MLCVESHVYSCICCVVLPILCVLGCRWWPLSHITTAVAVVGHASVIRAGSHKPSKRAPEKELRDERTNNAPPRDVARVRARCAYVCVRGLVVEQSGHNRVACMRVGYISRTCSAIIECTRGTCGSVRMRCGFDQ